jgi:uracil phosphoribosyltransferase
MGHAQVLLLEPELASSSSIRPDIEELSKPRYNRADLACGDVVFVLAAPKSVNRIKATPMKVHFNDEL